MSPLAAEGTTDPEGGVLAAEAYAYALGVVRRYHAGESPLGLKLDGYTTEAHVVERIAGVLHARYVDDEAAGAAMARAAVAAAADERRQDRERQDWLWRIGRAVAWTAQREFDAERAEADAAARRERAAVRRAERGRADQAPADVVHGSTERRERSRARAETEAARRFGEPAFASIEGRLMLALIRRHGRTFPLCRPGYAALKRDVGAGVAAIDAAANRLVAGGYLGVETPPRAPKQWRKTAWRKRKRYTVRSIDSWGPLA